MRPVLLFVLILTISISCSEEAPDSVEMPPSMSSQTSAFEDDPTSDKADSLLRFYQDLADTSSSDRTRIAEWYDSLATSFSGQEYWALSNQAHIQSIRHDNSKDNAPEQLIKLAQQLHLKESRVAVSKAAYQSVIEYYPESAQVEKAKKNIAEDQPSLYRQIQDLEGKLMSQAKDSVEVNKKAARDYISCIQIMAAIEPEHEEAPLLLNRAAAMAKALGNYHQAIDLYNWVIGDYEDTEQAKKALFYKGFALDEEMEEFKKAEQAYEKFLQKYPKDDLAEQVQILKSQLGKSDEEILEELKRKNANQE